ncbi:hypothetical protein BDY21DRAFT_347421 [Lineolata rhizophorae]|uniref:Uncharacterized protein n=1 Tax=Lineolata rhizophorae TaxID=578093 RepID=A0A6A6NXS7_9PEZI|nr:hypothetical protein BDY21DRAFT_347421 [Lineolata rhizophorae]
MLIIEDEMRLSGTGVVSLRQSREDGAKYACNGPTVHEVLPHVLPPSQKERRQLKVKNIQLC